MFGIGMQELLVILLIVLLLFGGKKVPEMMRGLGKGVRAFKDGMNVTGEDSTTSTSSTNSTNSTEAES